MIDDPRHSLSRRALLGAGLTGMLLSACCRAGGSGDGTTLAQRPPPRPLPARPPQVPTPSSGDHHDMPPYAPPAAPVCQLTEDNIEGPFFKAGAPHRSILVAPGDAGQRLQISGSVLSADCHPLSGAQMEIWQADATGTYDLQGFRYRGQLVTGADGAFDLQTIIPGRYLNGSRYRPAHIHIKLQAPGHRPLTTQLYFAGDPYNQGDPFIHRSLIMETTPSGALTTARFDFVLA